MKTKGERIKQLREDANMTQEELAKYLDTTKQTIHKYENNIVTNIPSDKIEIIAEVLNSDPSYIMGWTSSIQFDSGYQAYLTAEESEYLSIFNKIYGSTPETFEHDLKKFKKIFKNFKVELKNINIKSLNALLAYIEIEFGKINISGVNNIKELFEDITNYTEFSLKKIINKQEIPDYIQPVAAHLDGELTDEAKDFIDKF